MCYCLTTGMPAGKIKRTNVRSKRREVPAPPTSPDLVFGLICPVGCDKNVLSREIKKQLVRFGYEHQPVKVTSLFTKHLPHPLWKDLPPDAASDLRYRVYMTAGDALRRAYGGNDAAARLAVHGISDLRSGGSRGPKGTAFVIDSLKTPEEVSFLRVVYGSRFLCVAAYAPRDKRVEFLAKDIARSRNKNRYEGYRDKAEELISRDERGKEINAYGQNVGDAFPVADLVVDASDEGNAPLAIQRFFESLFGHPYHTPSRDEQGMALAYLASLRSSDMSRQVGAALVASDGSPIGIGCNDVPSFGGGLYWEGDAGDARDFVKGEEPADVRKRAVLANTIEVLMAEGWGIPTGEEAVTNEERRRIASDYARKLWLEKSDTSNVNVRRQLLISDLVDFTRAAHAEMAALMDATRRGVSVRDSTLYSTAFCCHECARLIVASGVRRVVFLEPYPKSLVTDFYADSIQLGSGLSSRVAFETFVGVAPRIYPTLFRSEVPRKDELGSRIEWTDADARPRSDIFGTGDSEAPQWARELHRHFITLEGLVSSDFMKAIGQSIRTQKLFLDELYTDMGKVINEENNHGPN
jgi:deoxycytidylate deaminase